MRYALPNSEFMLHQPLGGAQGPAADIDITARRILKLRSKINDFIAERTGQPLERIEKDTNRDFFLTAQEALEYGIVDRIITQPVK